MDFIAHIRELDGEAQRVEDHLLGVGELAAGFAAKVGLTTGGRLIGLLHDLGKYSQAFHERIHGGAEQVDHSTAGAQFVWNELASKGPFEAFLADGLAVCIASHHGGLIDCLDPSGVDQFAARIRKDDALTHLSEALSNVSSRVLSEATSILSEPGFVKNAKARFRAIWDRLAGLSLAASDLEARYRFECGVLLRMLFGCLIDADRTNTADFETPVVRGMRHRGDYPTWDTLCEKLEVKLAGFDDGGGINKIRKRVSDECLAAHQRPPGLFTLTVPTGGGKTLASLRFALNHARKWRKDHIFYVVPYTTIIDQNAEECRRVLEPANAFGTVVLEHHSNLSPDEETPKSRLLSENWDAPIVYTTMVQFLETLFGSGTRPVRRIHQLANAVIVFDEIQALPIVAVHLFCNAIAFLMHHCGTSVVLCTATQPLLGDVDRSKGALPITLDNEIIGDIHQLFSDLKRVDVIDDRKAHGWTEDEIVDLAAKSVNELGSCLLIVNTKGAAKSLYNASRARQPAFEVFHLSTSMCPAHRVDVLRVIEQRLGKGGKPPEHPGRLMCISTQLIEAGVDVDFRVVVRYLAGLDSIQPAAGRCNRHNRERRGFLHIINPADEDLRRLEEIRVGRDQTERILGEFARDSHSLGTDLLGTEVTERYFRYFFFARKHLMDYPINAEREDTLLNMLSQNTYAVAEHSRVHGKAPSGSAWQQSFKAAAEMFEPIDAPTRAVVVPYKDEGRALVADLCAAPDAIALRKLLCLAQRFSVNVFPWELEQLRDVVHEVQKGSGVLYLESHHYSGDFGLSLEPVSDPELYVA